MLIDLLYLVIGLVGLYYGAEWLVGGSSKLALRLGVTPLVIGLTVVAFGTSAPELAVCLQLNLTGLPDAAVGNVVGSNICNILLILGVSALMRPIEIKSQVIRREMPVLIVVSLVFVAVLWDGVLARWEGGVLVVGIVGYVWASFALVKRVALPEVEEEFAVEIGRPEEAEAIPGKVLAGLILAGLVLLVAGAKFFQLGGVGIAQRFGISDAVIGLTVLAFGTSLPELATSMVATAKGEGDIIAGNAVGSSIFNVLAILGITVLVKPMLISGIVPLDLWFMVGSAAICVPLMWTRSHLSRVEGGCLLVAYLIFVGLLVMRGGVPHA